MPSDHNGFKPMFLNYYKLLQIVIKIFLLCFNNEILICIDLEWF